MKRITSATLLAGLGIVFCISLTPFAWAVEYVPLPENGHIAVSIEYQDGVRISETDKYGNVTHYSEGRRTHTTDINGDDVSTIHYYEGTYIIEYIENNRTGERTYYRRDGKVDYREDKEGTRLETWYYGDDGFLTHSIAEFRNETERTGGPVTTFYEGGLMVNARAGRNDPDGEVVQTPTYHGNQLMSLWNAAYEDTPESTTYFYGDGSVSHTTNADGGITSITRYDADTGKISTTEYYDGLTLTGTVYYDDLGRQSYMEDRDGNRVREWVYAVGTTTVTYNNLDGNPTVTYSGGALIRVDDFAERRDGNGRYRFHSTVYDDKGVELGEIDFNDPSPPVHVDPLIQGTITIVEIDGVEYVGIAADQIDMFDGQGLRDGEGIVWLFTGADVDSLRDREGETVTVVGFVGSEIEGYNSLEPGVGILNTNDLSLFYGDDNQLDDTYIRLWGLEEQLGL